MLVTLLLSFSLIGCRSSGNIPCPNSMSGTPSTDAYALSGGKITRFTTTPGLRNSPSDKAMLLACRQLILPSHTARSAFLVVTAGQFGRVPISALCVGNKTLMLPGDFITMGMNHGLGLQGMTGAEHGVGSIVLVPNSNIAYVGQKEMKLHDPVLSVATKDLVMNWVDMLSLLKERDQQRHQPPFIRSVQIIYDIQDYHR